MTTSENDKTEEKRFDMLGRKEKSNISKTKNTTRGNKSGGTGERRKAKNISRQDKTIQTKQEISKQRTKFYQQADGECKKTYQQLDDKETKEL